MAQKLALGDLLHLSSPLRLHVQSDSRIIRERELLHWNLICKESLQSIIENQIPHFSLLVRWWSRSPIGNMLNKFYIESDSHAMPALINWSDPRNHQQVPSSTNFHAEQFQIYGLMYISLIGRLPLADSTPRWEEDCAPGARIIAPKPLRGQTHLDCSLAPKVFKVSDWDSGGHVMTWLLGQVCWIQGNLIIAIIS